MHIIRRPSWQLRESAATPEHLFLSRRGFVGGAIAAAAAGLVPDIAHAQRIADLPDPTSDL